MKAEVQFVVDRANATNAVAEAILADWEWAEKTVVQMTADTKALTDQAAISDNQASVLKNTVSQKSGAFINYHQNTVTLLGMTRTHYRNNSAALATLKNLHAKGYSEQDIIVEGATFANVWKQLDATYVPDKGWTLTAYQAAGTDLAAKAGAVTTAAVAATNESAKTDDLAAGVEDTNVAWYADATKKFGPDTPNGVIIRQRIPTTTSTVNPPAPPVVEEAQALGGGKVHIDFQKPDSGYIQILHQGPGEPAFTVLVDHLNGLFFEQGGFAPGAHSFKFVGINSGGPGDESAPIVIQVT